MDASRLFLFAAPLLAISCAAGETHSYVAYSGSNWSNLLDRDWVVQNAPQPHLLSGRWRENVSVENGVLRLLIKKEKRQGQAWSAGSICTRSRYLYGTYTATYRYASGSGANNSFWLVRDDGKKSTGNFEIDVNEGKYPNILATNIHDWGKIHSSTSKLYSVTQTNSIEPRSRSRISFLLSNAVNIRKIELRTHDLYQPKIREIEVIGAGASDPIGVSNLASSASVRASSISNNSSSPQVVVDGNINDSLRWTPNVSDELPSIELSWPTPVSIKSLTVHSGWLDTNGFAQDSLQDFDVRASTDEGTQLTLVARPETLISSSAKNLSSVFSTYRVDWTKDSISFYFNDRLYRRTPNRVAHLPANICLSLAVADWAGKVSPSLHLSSMDIVGVEFRDFVYQGTSAD